MKICLISNDNGWGLTQDVKLLEKLLAPRHTTTFQQWDAPRMGAAQFDINLHIELVGSRHFKSARNNWLLPNQEWFLHTWFHSKGRFNRVLCKTKCAAELFSGFEFRGVEYTGFTTEDICDLTIQRKFEFLHVSGNSRFKGTKEVIAAWSANPQWPRLHLYNTWDDLQVNLPNVSYHYGRVSTEHLRQIQNQCLVHVQPSAAEGFGHIIWEGLSVGAIVITSDAPPMNELENVVLVPAKATERYNNGMLYRVDVPALVDTINNVLNWRDVTEHQKLARATYINNDIRFKGILKNVFR